MLDPGYWDGRADLNNSCSETVEWETARVGSSPGELRRRGFVVLRGEVDPGPIAGEVDRVLHESYGGGYEARTLAQGAGTVNFRYVPMMCERTPVSLGLLDQFAVTAAELLGRQVLPGRAKGTRYYGDTGWHRDSEHHIASLGFITYLERVDGDHGALQVVPGSHADSEMALPGTGPCGPTEAIATRPGDVIVFDEHLIHGSSGGHRRRQWRVDFVIEPHDSEESAAVRAWFGQSVPDEADHPAYDVERYPSYGTHWRTRLRPWTATLAALGLYGSE
jgi:hypothetical protein